MGIDLTELDKIVTFLDSHKGAYWETPEDIQVGRNIQNRFTVVNNNGEAMEVSLNDLAMLNQLLCPLNMRENGHNHPVVVLNEVWSVLTGVALVGNAENLKRFDIHLGKDTITITLSDKNDRVQTSSISAGLSARLMFLRSFSEVDPAMANGIAAWPGKVTISAVFDGDKIDMVIDGVQLPDEGVAKVNKPEATHLKPRTPRKPSTKKATT